MQIVVFNWNDDAAGGSNLMGALGEVGFVHVLYQWVTGQINCNMQAGRPRTSRSCCWRRLPAR
ncbi:hypothetical protein [Nonomuraea insulae]|uniref:Uncharacterized protein n=1 Tax=Nonomuraea insulae TaxID=1616787 RepID=A0ABW1CEB2_9ACTN